MILLRDIRDLGASQRGGAVTIGNFDGVHLGHAQILQRLVARAKELGGPALVFTFDPHPVRLLRPESAPPPLTWTERKATLLAREGVDVVLAYRTDRALLSLEPDEFFQRLIVDQLGAKALIEGPNFFFGRDRRGDVALLRELCAAADIGLEVVSPTSLDDHLVSSSRVRALVRDGQVGPARHLLTEPYRIRGLVTHGARRGATIGFPTANLAGVDTLLPAVGVFAGRAYVDTGVVPAAINIGPNPTFGEHAVKVEAHLLDFAGTLYGQPLEVDFLERLRDIQPFPSIQDLQAQLARDVARTREIFDEVRRTSQSVDKICG